MRLLNFAYDSKWVDVFASEFQPVPYPLLIMWQQTLHDILKVTPFRDRYKKYIEVDFDVYQLASVFVRLISYCISVYKLMIKAAITFVDKSYVKRLKKSDEAYKINVSGIEWVEEFKIKSLYRFLDL